ncbi:MAG TPA: DNA polymerase III subunit delta [Acidimicrobiales bacterium]|nr:DNA polymerase III subunit delta [Acidimicrobiales bacterium]
MSDLRAAYVVRGEDPALLAQAVQQLVAGLVDGRDAATVVEEHGAAGADIDPGAVVDALATPPFITDRRVVVVREAGRLVAADAARIASCLADPVPGVALVLVAGGGTIPAALVKAADKLGGAVDSSVGSGRARGQWVADQVRKGPVRLDARATALVGEHLGGDLGRLQGLLQTLASAYGEGAAVDEEKLAPFLGEAGAVAPWDLTDAIDAGDDVGALRALDRLLGASGQHPLQVLASLHRHFEAMLRLDGAGITTPEEAAAHIGARSVYPAKKALEQGRRLGAGRIGRAVTLLADADLDVRGRSGLPDETVLQVLVARLSRLAAGTGRSAAGRSRRRASA